MANEAALADHMRTTGSVVYFVTPIRSRRVKIGTSTDFPSRLKAIQATNHVPLSVLLLMPGDIGTEGQLHQRFRKYRVRGEWFTLSDEIKTFIGENGGRWMPPSGSYTVSKRATEQAVHEALERVERALSPCLAKVSA